jgi:hypothetical protein
MHSLAKVPRKFTFNTCLKRTPNQLTSYFNKRLTSTSVVTPHTWLVKSTKFSVRLLHPSAVSMRRRPSKSSRACEVAVCTRKMSGRNLFDHARAALPTPHPFHHLPNLPATWHDRVSPRSLSSGITGGSCTTPEFRPLSISRGSDKSNILGYARKSHARIVNVGQYGVPLAPRSGTRSSMISRVSHAFCTAWTF